MNHRMARTLAASLLALAALALCSGCARLLSAGHVNKAAQHTLGGEYDAAIAEGTKAIEAKPDHHLAYINRAVAYTYARRYDLAEADFRRAIALEPEEVIPQLGYVLLLVFMRREEQAAGHAEKFLRSHPDSALLKCGLAAALERSKDYPRAHELASRCIAEVESEANPKELRYGAKQDFAPVLGLHARLAARVGRKDEAWQSISAVADFSKALELDPKFVDARRNRGTVYLGQKRYESASRTSPLCSPRMGTMQGPCTNGPTPTARAGSGSWARRISERFLRSNRRTMMQGRCCGNALSTIICVDEQKPALDVNVLGFAPLIRAYRSGAAPFLPGAISNIRE